MNSSKPLRSCRSSVGRSCSISFGYLFDNLVLVTGKQGRLVKICLAALVFNVAGNLAFVPVFGFHAAAWMTLATEALVAGLEIKLVTESVSLGEITYGRILRTTVCAVLLAGELAIAKALGAGLGVLVGVACVNTRRSCSRLGGCPSTTSARCCGAAGRRVSRARPSAG